MGSVTILEGDLLQCTNLDAIGHQVNCLCTKAHGLSKALASKYPWSDIYGTRRPQGGRNLAVEEDRGIPGTVQIFKSQDGSGPDVACLMGQWDYGAPGTSRRHIRPYLDTAEQRITWFKQCLHHLSTTNIKSIAFPYKIGCGLAGGDWNVYLEVIQKFAAESEINVVLVKLKEAVPVRPERSTRMMKDILTLILANDIRRKTGKLSKRHCYGCRNGDERYHSCIAMDETERLTLWFEDAIQDVDFRKILEIWEKEVRQTSITPCRIQSFKEKVIDTTWQEKNLPDKDKMYDTVKRLVQVENRL